MELEVARLLKAGMHQSALWICDVWSKSGADGPSIHPILHAEALLQAKEHKRAMRFFEEALNMEGVSSAIAVSNPRTTPGSLRKANLFDCDHVKPLDRPTPATNTPSSGSTGLHGVDGEAAALAASALPPELERYPLAVRARVRVAECSVALGDAKHARAVIEALIMSTRNQVSSAAVFRPDSLPTGAGGSFLAAITAAVTGDPALQALCDRAVTDQLPMTALTLFAELLEADAHTAAACHVLQAVVRKCPFAVEAALWAVRLGGAEVVEGMSHVWADLHSGLGAAQDPLVAAAARKGASLSHQQHGRPPSAGKADLTTPSSLFPLERPLVLSAGKGQGLFGGSGGSDGGSDCGSDGENSDEDIQLGMGSGAAAAAEGGGGSAMGDDPPHGGEVAIPSRSSAVRRTPPKAPGGSAQARSSRSLSGSHGGPAAAAGGAASGRAAEGAKTPGSPPAKRPMTHRGTSAGASGSSSSAAASATKVVATPSLVGPAAGESKSRRAPIPGASARHGAGAASAPAAAAATASSIPLPAFAVDRSGDSGAGAGLAQVNVGQVLGSVVAAHGMLAVCKHQEALAEAESLLSRYPGSVRLQLLRARVQAQTHDPLVALRTLAAITATEPTSTEGVDLQAFLTTVEGNRWRRAATSSLAQRALAHAPHRAETWIACAADADQRGDGAQVSECLARALAIAPRHSIALTMKGWVLSRAQRFEEAFRALTAAFATNGQGYADIYVAMGMCEAYTGLKLPAQAVVAARSALRAAPKSPRALFVMGMALMGLNTVEAQTKAVTAFARAIELDPRAHDASMFLAKLYWATGKHAEAIQVVEAFLARESSLDAHTQLAGMLAAVGDVAGATANYQRALKLNPEYGPALQGMEEMEQGVAEEEAPGEGMEDQEDAVGADAAFHAQQAEAEEKASVSHGARGLMPGVSAAGAAASASADAAATAAANARAMAAAASRARAAVAMARPSS